jgi:hypothetical protein
VPKGGFGWAPAEDISPGLWEQSSCFDEDTDKGLSQIIERIEVMPKLLRRNAFR